MHLTTRQMEDLILCLDFAMRRNAGCDNLTEDETRLVAASRTHLLASLARVLKDGNASPLTSTAPPRESFAIRALRSTGIAFGMAIGRWRR